ncbi:hypothetical protein OIK40_02915 [Erythrobacter sp. sf7]|uniref:Uncharacterized protein n=1 Tax=Erythrobacter fulvus TaxID=2987523 RepID=A0ABT5JM48_9SPHN|nr:hypothetical protein [Erythrobacter fulvus]MDC8753591.1 hypothetical protein [Erythrobacter fulvus]
MLPPFPLPGVVMAVAKVVVAVPAEAKAVIAATTRVVAKVALAKEAR